MGLYILRSIALLLLILTVSLPVIDIERRFAGIGGFAAVYGVEFFFVLSGFLIGTILIKLHNVEGKRHFRM